MTESDLNPYQIHDLIEEGIKKNSPGMPPDQVKFGECREIPAGVYSEIDGIWQRTGDDFEKA